jgi:hypothetical protein
MRVLVIAANVLSCVRIELRDDDITATCRGAWKNSISRRLVGMRTRTDWLLGASFIVGMLGCGSSSPAQPGAGTGGTDEATAGSSADAGSSSSKDAGSPDAAGSGNTSNGGKGGTSSKAGSGGSSAPKGGSGAAGKGGAAGSGSGAAGSTSTLPDDGNQLALCTMAQGDCNKGYACYSPATIFSSGRGFCSKICTMASDCDGLAPSGIKYECPTGNGTHVCEIPCTGTDDTMSCPSNMTCQQTAGGGGGAAGQSTAVYHCKYPLEESGAWGPCQDGTHKCGPDLTCNGAGLNRAGHCAQSCMMDSDCSEKPSSGSISPTCATISAARGMTPAVKLCVLSCLDAKDGCPSDLMCVNGPTMGGGGPRGGGGAGGAGGSGGGTPTYARCQ